MIHKKFNKFNKSYHQLDNPEVEDEVYKSAKRKRDEKRDSKEALYGYTPTFDDAVLLQQGVREPVVQNLPSIVLLLQDVVYVVCSLFG